MIRVLYFARLREEVGVAEEALEAGALPTLGDLRALLQGRGGRWAEALGEGRRVLMAVNQEMAEADQTIRDGDEVAFFPPVTGG